MRFLHQPNVVTVMPKTIHVANMQAQTASTVIILEDVLAAKLNMTLLGADPTVDHILDPGAEVAHLLERMAGHRLHMTAHHLVSPTMTQFLQTHPQQKEEANQKMTAPTFMLKENLFLEKALEASPIPTLPLKVERNLLNHYCRLPRLCLKTITPVAHNNQKIIEVNRSQIPNVTKMTHKPQYLT